MSGIRVGGLAPAVESVDSVWSVSIVRFGSGTETETETNRNSNST